MHSRGASGVIGDGLGSGWQYVGGYNQMNKQQLSFGGMRRQSSQPSSHTKIRTTFKYELQDHNQIYRQGPQPFQYPSELHSTAQSNPHLSLPPYQDSQSQSPRQLYPTAYRHRNLSQRTPLSSRHVHKPQTHTKQTHQALQDDLYMERILCLKEESAPRRAGRSRREKERSMAEKDELDIFLCSSQSPEQMLRGHHKRQSTRRQLDLRAKQEEKSESNKQKLGLASISEQVKKIVADRGGQMTFKEVSDELLKNQTLSDNLEDRKREMSNIRRRVYDALNVLLTVKILGRQHRYVVPTNSTYIQGKKHSQHWIEINKKKDALRQLQDDYNHKKHIYDLLKEKHELMLRLHARNKQQQEHAEARRHGRHKFSFPLVCWVPKRQAGKIVVNIEHQKNDRQQDIKKYTILGANQAVQTDIDLLKFIRLPEKMAQSGRVAKKEVAAVDDIFCQEGEDCSH